MELYRLISGKDDVEFCKRITHMLNNGWKLYGSPSISTSENRNQVAQAMTKIVEDREWSDDVELSEY